MTAFAKYRDKIYKHQYRCEIIVDTLVGGTPSDPKQVEGWLKTKLADKDDLVRQEVAEVMAATGVDAEDAVAQVAAKGLQTFKRDESGLYIEGRQIKAAFKEAASVAANAGNIPTKGWGCPDNGNYKKGIKGWLPEHVFIKEARIHLGRDVPDGTHQRFIHKHTGSSFLREDYCEDVKLTFHVGTDYDVKEAHWAAIWLTGERQGIGASRSQGYGTYTVVSWEKA